MNRIANLVLGVAATAAVGAWFYVTQLGPSPLKTESRETTAPLGKRDLGVYYRMTAEYKYKGEPLVLDFGISCGSIWENPNQHKMSMDVFAGPKLYGVRTKDNKAVVVSTSNYCDTLLPFETRGPPPPDFLPTTLIYDDPDKLYSATLYASDEAYHNSSSELTEPTVRFERLTAEQLLALRKTQVPNVVRSRGNEGITNQRPWRQHEIQRLCLGVAKYTLTDYGREQLRNFWPESKPDYWTIAENRDHEIERIIRQRNPETVVGGDGKGVAMGVASGRESGLSRTSGQGARLEGGGDVHYVPPFYPIVPRSTPNWDTAQNKWAPGELHYDIDVREAARGFLSCNAPVTRGPTSEAQLLSNPNSKSELRSRYASARFTINGEPILLPDGTQVRGIEFGWKNRIIAFRDELLFLEINSAPNGTIGEQGDE
jgi:hypothetical protein